MTNTPVRLKALLQERRWQTYRIFKREYDKAAKLVDPDLVGSWPSQAQFARWLSGDVKGLPYADHCRVLERMLPDWTAEQLFQRSEQGSVPTRNDEPHQASTGNDHLARVIEDHLARPAADDAEWRLGGDRDFIPGESPATGDATSNSEISGDRARRLGRCLLDLKQRRHLSDAEIKQLAGLAGAIVELARVVDIGIDAAGNVHVTYHFDFLNLSSTPLTRVTRELWFEYADYPLTIVPAPDSERRLIIQRIHDTSNLSKFAFQISPPIQPGEAARVGYSCDGGRFADNHYWREDMSHYTRHYVLNVRQEKVQVTGCTATEEHPDGAEVSAAGGLTWDDDADGISFALRRDYLQPKQTVTLRWEITRDPA
jgi:hypothetical protein